MRRKELTLPTLIGLLVAAAGLISGLWLVQRQKNDSAQALSDDSPNSVVVSNLGDTGFSVSWTTTKAMAGFVQYGEAGSSLDVVVSDERDQQKGSVDSYFTHFVTLKGLKPGTGYEFKIGSGKGVFDNEGKNYQVTTGPTIEEQPAADVAYGQVVTVNGDPAEGALVYLKLPGAGSQATIVKPSGSWVIPLSTARGEDGQNFVSYDPEKAVFSLVIDDGPLGSATVEAMTGNDSPVAQVTLGGNYDYTINATDASASAVESKFSRTNEGWESQIGESEEIRILTPKVGELVGAEVPQVEGEAPAGTLVTIEIHSDEVITGSVVADAEGKFTFDVPSNLSPGLHTITITAIVNGITQKVTRSFTVYAAEENGLPAFSATPSATRVPPTPTNTPTAAPTGVPSASPSPTVLPTSKPTATPMPTTKPTPVPTVAVATSSGTPVSGNGDLTWMTLLAGMAMISGGWWWYRKAEK